METEAVFAEFRRVAERNPRSVALVVDGVEYLYSELLERVMATSRVLAESGCQAGVPLVLIMSNSVDFVINTLAGFSVGCVVVPLNPKLRNDELDYIISTCGARHILSDVKNGCQDESVLVDGASGVMTVANGGVTGVYMFSSGSTGKSKRVTRSQQQLLMEYQAFSAAVGLTASDKILCTIPLFHSHGFGNAMLAALLSGAVLVMQTSEFNARSVAKAMSDYQITIYPAVPFMIKMLAEARFANKPDLKSLRFVISAGAPLPDTVSEKFAEAHGVYVSQLYGSTETGAVAVNVGNAPRKPASVGRPLPGYGVKIKDDAGDYVDVGVPGEVWVYSPAIARQYDDLPDLSEKCFSGGYFDTGDIGYVDSDGDLYISGRKKLMLNVAGYKVDPIEVESVILQHPKVAEAIVVGVDHPGYGEKIKAVVVARPELTCTESEIIEFVTPLLAEYKVPKLVQFIDEIPRSPLGKVLRKYL